MYGCKWSVQEASWAETIDQYQLQKPGNVELMFGVHFLVTLNTSGKKKFKSIKNKLFYCRCIGI